MKKTPLILAKVKHISDTEYEELGIFSSPWKMEEAERAYLKERAKTGIKPECYLFTYQTFLLDEIQ